MDKALIRERFARATSSYLKHASVQQHVADRMIGLLKAYVPSGFQQRVWETGCGTGLFTYRYLETFSPQEMWLNDICPEVETCFEPVVGERIHFVPGDAERLTPPEKVDLVVSCSALQWLDDPIGYLRRCREWLVQEGYVAVSTFGPKNMHELAVLADAGLAYLPFPFLLEEVRKAGYTVLYADEEQIDLSFPSAVDVLRHLKQTGVTGVVRQHWTRGRLEAFAHDYRTRFGRTDGTVPLTYHPIYLILKK